MSEAKRRELVVLGSALLLPLVLIGAIFLIVRRAPSAVEAGDKGGEALCRRGMVRLLERAQHKLTLELYTSKAKLLETASAKLDRKLKRLASEAGGKIDYRRVNVSDQATQARAEQLGLQPVSLGDATGVMLEKSYFGIVFEYGSEQTSIPLLDPQRTDGIEFWLGNKIREVVAKAENHNTLVGVLSGNEELGLSDAHLVPSQMGSSPSIKTILAQAFPFYKIVEVGPTASDGELADMKALFVTQPGRSLTDAELRFVDGFLMRGERTVAVMAGAANLDLGDAEMRVKLDRRGVDKLLDGYGIELHQDLLFDATSSVAVTVTGLDGKVSQQRFPGFLVVTPPQLNDKFAAFFRLDEVAFPLSSSLSLHPERQPEAKLEALAKTTPQATSSSAEGVSLAPGEPAPQGKAGEQTIAAVVTGKLKSAFDDRRAEGRVLVIASSAFVTNPLTRAAAGEPGGDGMMGPKDSALGQFARSYAQRHLTSTILVVKSTFDWATADEQLIACSALLSPKAKP